MVQPSREHLVPVHRARRSAPRGRPAHGGDASDCEYLGHMPIARGIPAGAPIAPPRRLRNVAGSANAPHDPRAAAFHRCDLPPRGPGPHCRRRMRPLVPIGRTNDGVCWWLKVRAGVWPNPEGVTVFSSAGDVGPRGAGPCARLVPRGRAGLSRSRAAQSIRQRVLHARLHVSAEQDGERWLSARAAGGRSLPR